MHRRRSSLAGCSRASRVSERSRRSAGAACTAWTGPISRVPTEPGRYRAFYELMRDAIRGEGPVPVDPLDSLRVLRVLEAAERAAATWHRPVDGGGLGVVRAKVGLGVVGAGRMGAILARAIAHEVPEARLVGIADLDLGAARRLAGELGVDAVFELGRRAGRAPGHGRGSSSPSRRAITSTSSGRPPPPAATSSARSRWP